MSDDAFDLIEEDVNTTPEDHFYQYLTAEKMPKIYNCEYWLRHELAVYAHLRDTNYHLTKSNKAPVFIQELVRVLLSYYFQMYFLPRFVRTDGRPACDMGKFLDLVMSDPTIKKYLREPSQS